MNILQKNVNDQGYITISGVLASFAVKLSVELRLSNSANDKAPDWLVFAKAPHGDWVEVGVAWQKTIQRGNSIGMTMFTISLVDPAFNGVGFTAFPDGDGVWKAQVERPRQASAEKASAEATS